MILLSFFLTCLTSSTAFAEKGDCTFYDMTTTNCADTNCGTCFNPGSRAGEMCHASGPQGGYLCSASSPSPDMAYACMDWSSGSTAMQEAEKAYEARTGQSVYFGVGTYGTDADVQRGLGACYLITVDTVNKPLLVQSINMGYDVSESQFDLMQGDGGFGAYNTCAGGEESMFPGDKEPWGNIYGGVDYRTECAGLPSFPKIDGPMKDAGDDLVDMCEISFDRGYRLEGGGNPSIQELSRVECPDELVEFTWMKRNDDPAFDEPILIAKNTEDHVCQLPISGAWCLTRMMDCRKPSGSWPNNVKSELMVDGMKLTQFCSNDGYTRYDVQCGCFECYC